MADDANRAHGADEGKTERGELLDLALAVSDGHEVTWDEKLSSLPPGERTRARWLKQLGNIAALNRRLQRPDGPDSAEAERTRPELRVPAASPAQDGPEPSLTCWGPLQIRERLGQGSFGEVYRAYDARLDRDVALKLLAPGDPRSGRSGSLVIEEARRMARLDEPHVVRVYGADRHEGRVGLWMELLEGKTLRDLTREQGPFGAQEAALIGIDLCRALAAVHASGQIHRDVKAQNVMRASGGRIVLMDFGTGADLDPDSQQSTCEDLSGTPLYMAPEILEGGQPSRQSDIYSLGVLLFHLVTGAYPVEADTLADLRAALREGRVTLLQDLRPGLPEATCAAVRRATAPDPAQRYATAGEMERALQAALGDDSSSRREREIITSRPRWPSRGGVVAGAAAALLAVVAIGFWALRSHAPDARHDPPEAAAVAKTAPAEALGVDFTLFRRGALVDEPLGQGDAVSVGDRLFVEVRCEEPTWLYLLNSDLEGRSFVLFPLVGMGATNPLAPGSAHHLPGEVGARKAAWTVSSSGGEERFLLVASRRRLPELEERLAAFEQAELGRPLEVAPETIASLRAAGELHHRGVGGVAPLPESDEGDERRQALRAALARADREGGLLIREMVLENTGR